MAASFGKNPAASLSAMLHMGADHAGQGVNSAQQGVNAVINAGGQIRSDTAKMRNQARLVNSQGDAVNATAQELKGYAGEIKPYAGDLNNIGNILLGEGNTLWNRSNDVFGQGGALVSMDRNAGGLAGEFLKQYDLLSPDRYVSQAASDVQGAHDNAIGQMQRANARRGVSAGSGADNALAMQYRALLATSLAAAKTKARQMGIDEQTKMLSTITGAANTLYSMGNETAQAAVGAQSAGANAKKGAADVLSSAANVIGNAGTLQASAAQIYKSASDIYGDSAAIETNYANVMNNAYKSLSQAQSAAANYYLGAARVEVDANRGINSGGVNIIDNTNRAIEARQAANPRTSGMIQMINGKTVLV